MPPKSVYLIALVISLFVTCDSEQPAPIAVSQDGNNYYDENIQSLFDHYCLTCHGDQQRQFEELYLISWETLIRGSKHGEVVIPFDSENSLMIERMTKFQIGRHGFAAPHPGDHWMPYLTGAEINKLARWIDAGARNRDNVVPYQTSRKRLYVCSERAGLISVIETDAKLVIRNIKFARLGYPPDSQPHHIVIEPETGVLYVSLHNQDRVLKLNADYRLVGEAVVTAPGMLAIDPARDVLYVARFAPEREAPNSLAVVQLSTMIQIAELEMPLVPDAIAVDVQASGEIYAASLNDNRIFAIDVATGRHETVLFSPVGAGPAHLVIAPTTRRLYVAAALSNELLVIDLSADTLIARVPVGERPWRVAAAPDDSRVFVANLGANSISVVDAEEWTVEKVITGNGLAEPSGMFVSADGKYLFVANRNASGVYHARRQLTDNEKIGTVVVINTATGSIEKIIEVEEYATGIAL